MMEKLSQRVPNDAAWQRDLFISQTKVGEVFAGAWRPERRRQRLPEQLADRRGAGTTGSE